LLSQSTGLKPGDSVLIGDAAVGKVSAVVARRRVSSAPLEEVKLLLDPSIGGLPVDTTVKVCLASAAGPGFVQLAPGVSDRNLPEGGTLPLSQTNTQAVC
jgi:ABC-type transporter Mla subunit MlaD